MKKVKHSNKNKEPNNWKVIIEEWSLIIFAIAAIIFLEITAFRYLPQRGLIDLVRDLIASLVGFFVGYLVRKIEKYIAYDFRLNIVFGFFFLGLGMVINSLLKSDVKFFLNRESYIGLMISTVSICVLLSMDKKSR
jgi:hypothetical protein